MSSSIVDRLDRLGPSSLGEVTAELEKADGPEAAPRVLGLGRVLGVRTIVSRGEENPALVPNDDPRPGR